MKKSNKSLLFERMNKIGGMPINENVNEDVYAEKAGQGQGIVTNLLSNIDEAIKYMDEMLRHSPELATDIENIKKRLTLGIDNARGFGEGKEHKKKVGIRGLWGVDDDNDGLVDGSADGGFGGDGGGGEAYHPIKEEEEKWMQDAVKHKGALSKRLGIPEEDDIPMERINSEIKKLDAKYKDGEKMSADDRNFKRQLTLAKTFKKTK